ncbi:MAG: adenine phosphoribosyltransferase [Alphaproteobacteria bacterium]|nr:adenine phosphoribosyltransferase [Alphaproteobacteria bacterium]MDX9690476.1 adenine phosphoribosyltransferase [Alphaproteobacteria bacterium]
MNLKEHIRTVPDFPKEGILFYDIGTLLAHGPAWKETVERMTALIEPDKPDLLFAIESRGFLVAAPIAARLGIGMVMIRKKGKLPGATCSYHYDLEYGSDTIEIQDGIFPKGSRGVLVDDLLATGGTAHAAHHLATEAGATITSAAFVIELPFLGGRNKVSMPIHTLLSYDE